MEQTSEKLYLDLLKKTLTYSLWPIPLEPIENYSYRRKKFKRLLIKYTLRVLRKKNLRIVKEQRYSEDQVNDGLIWPTYAYTMVGLKRLDNLQNCIEIVIQDEIEGDFIETGVWRGGACIFMRAALAVYGIDDRRVFVADSFEGLPKPDLIKYPQDSGDTHYTHEVLAVSLEQVKENFERFKLLDEKVVFLRGLFKDTLSIAPIEKLSIIRLDGDMYSSTMDAIIELYPKLSRGGFCIIDDYALPGCKQAVDDYRESNQIDAPLNRIDWTGVYWRK
jgi:hypothetical protein